MTRLFFGICIFWSISIGLAQAIDSVNSNCTNSSEKVKNSLLLRGFKCSAKTQNNCTYQECIGLLPSYPKPVLISIPAITSGLRIHFHGHKLGKFPGYEKNLSSMISQFKLNSELCKSSDVTIFPESDGNCSTYDQTLNTKKDFTNFLNELHSATGSYLKGAPLSVSAHSGGGRTITRMLDAGLTINQVTIFDGIYSEGQKNSLKNWFIKGGGKLFISTVRGMSPENYTQLLKEELGIKMAQTRSTLGGTIFDVFSSEHLTHYSRSTGEVSSLKAHYDVLTQTWPAGN